jgi:beta-glucosidase
MALLAGTDLECGSGSWAPGSPDAFLSLGDAVEAGLVRESDLDNALRRLFRAQMRLGVYDPEERVPYARLAYETVVDSPKHRELALEAAREAIVLLKNQGATLPFRRGLGTIAVIGPNAAETEVLLGNYNGTPVAPVSILAGLKAKVGASTKVLYARGAPLAEGLPDLQVVPGSALFTTSGGKRVGGLKGEYYRGHFEGGPVLTRVDATVDFDWGDGVPAAGLGDDFSVRWTGEIQAPATGRYTLGFRALTAFRLLIDNKPVASGRSDHEPVTGSGSVTLRAGRSYPIRIELEHEKYDALGRLLWEVPGGRGDEAGEAIAAAKAADAVVMVLGLSSQLEGEEMPVRIEGFSGGDRTSLNLPKVQQALLERVLEAATGKPVVLVLLNGSALGVGWADANVPAIVEAWYPGQAGGTAVADVLFGDANPGGRLPVTFYRSVDQLPPFEDYAMKGRTYRYFTGEPLYPFGHGLSFTRFAYARLRVPRKAPVGAPVEVAVEVRNVGARAGDEVVQLYVTDREASGPVPLKALKGFRRVTLQPGEKRLVTLTLSERDFSLIAADGQRVVEPGLFRIAVGGRQPGLEGRADGSTTAVVTADLELTGMAKHLAP